MLVPALRRFAFLLALAAAATGVVSLILGALTGASLDRAVSVGFYVAGSVLMVGGLFVGNRGPVRPVGNETWGVLPFRRRGVRWASLDEQHESINFSALLVAIGLVLVFLGIVVDPRVSLV